MDKQTDKTKLKLDKEVGGGDLFALPIQHQHSDMYVGGKRSDAGRKQTMYFWEIDPIWERINVCIFGKSIRFGNEMRTITYRIAYPYA